MEKYCHIYTYPTNITFCWFGNFYIRFQDKTGLSLGYALIQSQQTENTKKEFQALQERNVLQEISLVEFHSIFNKASNMLNNLITK
jgi:hypothetical protein